MYRMTTEQMIRVISLHGRGHKQQAIINTIFYRQIIRLFRDHNLKPTEHEKNCEVINMIKRAIFFNVRMH